MTITCMCNVYPFDPHFYIAKPGVWRGIPIFLSFAPKHRLWILVRIAFGEAILACTHNLCLEQKVLVYYTLCFEQKSRKLSKFFSLKFSIFKAKNICLLHGQVFVILEESVSFPEIQMEMQLF